MKRKVCWFLSILLVLVIEVFFAACDLSDLFNTNNPPVNTNGPSVNPNNPPDDPNNPPVDPNDPPVAPNQTPFVFDYTISNMNQTEGNVTAVIITAKEGKSPGAIRSIQYNGSTTVPQAAGYYAVAFDVAPATGWNSASGLMAGTLTVTPQGGGTPPVIGGGGQTPDGFIYTETASAVTIIGYVGTSKDVTIPAQINGKPVTTIGDSALFQKQLTGVTIPNSVTTIGDGAFATNQLSSVSIPDSVTTIGDGAFTANLLTNVTIPNSVTYLSGFTYNQLTSVTIPNSVTTIGDYAFAFNQLTSIPIPNNVIVIGEGAFYSNQLTSVTIGNKVTTVKNGAFAENQLSSVIFPPSVKTIEYNVFRHNLSNVNNNLISVTIGADVTLGSYGWAYGVNTFLPAFPLDLDNTYNGNGKQAGTYTRVNTSTTVWTLQGATTTQTPIASDYTIGNLNQTAESVTAVTITAKSGKSPGAVSNIRYNNSTTIPQTAGTFPVTFDVAAATGWSAAAGLSAGNLVVAPNSGGSQDASDFTYTVYATYVNITGYTGTSKVVTIPSVIEGKPVTRIGFQAFYNQQLTSVKIPDSVTYINQQAFRSNQLTSIIIPNNVTTIDMSAFSFNKLTSVNIPDSVTTIGEYAFTANQLTSVTISNGIIAISQGTFSDNLLTSVTIPDNVIFIGEHAFLKNQIASVIIPNNVKTVKEGAFWENPLTSVTIGADVKVGITPIPNIDGMIVLAFPGDLDTVYNSNGKLAGRYTRQNASSTAWTRQES
jgi:hypothetical protein